MSKLFVVLAALLVVASAAPKDKMQCPMDAIFACVGEVSGAWDNCWNAGDIMGCIQGVIGASDCWDCACDVLGWLGLMDC